MKIHLFTLSIFFFLLSHSVEAQNRMRKSIFEKVSFTVQTRDLPKKVLLSEYKTVNFEYKTYGKDNLDTVNIHLTGYKKQDKNADINIILYADRILDSKVQINSLKKSFQLSVNYICPITFEVINKEGIKIDGASIDDSKSWQTSKTWIYTELFDNENDAYNYFLKNKENIFKELSLKSFMESLAIFEKEINDLYGYKEGEIQELELFTLKKRKDRNECIDSINTTIINIAGILNQIKSDTDISVIRDSLSTYVSFLENEIKDKQGPLLLLKHRNLATIYLYTEQYDKVIEQAELIPIASLSAYFMSEVQSRKKLLEKHNLKSFSFPVSK